MQRFDVESLITMPRQMRAHIAVGDYDFDEASTTWATSTSVSATANILPGSARESGQFPKVWHGSVSLNPSRMAGGTGYESSFPSAGSIPRVEIIQGGIPNRDLAEKLNVRLTTVMRRVVGGGSATLASAPTWTDVEIERLIRDIRGDQLISHSGEIADRLDWLHRMDDDDLAGAGHLDVRSLRLFVASLRTIGSRRIPKISLSSAGFLYASWRDGENLFSVHYLPDGEVKWVHFRPAVGVLGIKEREYGLSSVDQLAEKMTQLRVSEWVSG